MSKVVLALVGFTGVSALQADTNLAPDSAVAAVEDAKAEVVAVRFQFSFFYIFTMLRSF